MYSAESVQSEDAEVMLTAALCEAYSTLMASPPALLALHAVGRSDVVPAVRAVNVRFRENFPSPLPL